MKKAIIFGASGGIGSELSRLLKKAGWSLCLAGRNAERLEQLSFELEERYSICDLKDPESVERFFQSEPWDKTECGAVVVAVGSILLKPVHLTSIEEWRDCISTNLDSAFFVLRAALKAKRPKDLQFLFFSSVAGSIGLKNHEAIASAKAGLEGLVRSAAASYAKQSVRINAIAPGLVKTPLSARLTKSAQSLEASEAMHPLGRIGEASEVAHLAAYMLSPDNSWMTGQIIHLDGGMSTLRA